MPATDAPAAPVFETTIDTASVTGSPHEFRFTVTPVGRPDVVRGGVAPGDVRIRDRSFPVPHEATFAARYNLHARTYYGFFDEALKYGRETALAMRRDGFVHELLRHRQVPSCSLPYSVDPEDPEDRGQSAVAGQLQRLVEALPRFQNMLIQLSEALFYGKSASQVRMGRVRSGGRGWNAVVGHLPVNGDKLRFKWDGTPGVEVNRGAGVEIPKAYEKDIEPVDQSPVLFLRNKRLRDRFVIHEFEPADTDYLFEGDQAAAVHGVGVRSRLFWTWNMRAELLGWFLDALQRVGVNGMLYGFYKTGDAASRDAVISALQNLVRENIAVFETDANFPNLRDVIQRIEPSQIGYDILLNFILHLEEIMRTAVLGQNLSSQSAPTGMNSGTSNLQGLTFEGVVRYDANALAETIEHQLLALLLKYNRFEYRGRWYWGDELPFTLRFKFQTDSQNILEKIQAATALHGMGVELDAENLRDEAGFKAPKVQANTLPGSSPDGPGGSQTPRGRSMSGSPGGDGAGLKPVGGARPAVAAGSGVERNAAGAGPDRSDDPGVAVLLKLPAAAAESLALPGGVPASDLHVTVAYLGRMSEVGKDAVNDAREILRMVAENYPPVAATVSGVGRFCGSPSSDGMDVFYASVDAPELADVRHELCRMFDLAGVPYRTDHGFTPHVTLKYLNASDPNPVDRIDPMPVEFREICLSVGGRKRAFSLEGELAYSN